MQQVNLKDKLLMREDHQKGTTHQLSYQSVQTQGQCVLKSIIPVNLNKVHYYIFCVVSILLLGIPIVLVYWYPNLKLHLYYHQCSYQEATDFAIINYDDQLTFANKKEQQIISDESFISGKITNNNQNQGQLKNNNYSANINQGQNKVENIVYFINRYMKYRLIERGASVIVKADIFDYETGIKKILRNNYLAKNKYIGYSQQKVRQIRQRFGPGAMEIQRPTLVTLFFRQIVQPLYFFILFTLVVWICQKYYYYCTVIFVTSAIGVVVNLYQTHQLNKKIYQMAYYQIDLNVLRQNQVVRISSKDVVPGDVVFLKQPIKMSFDGLILQQSALINQCALTGQSVPVVRKAQQFQRMIKSQKISIHNNLVCEGTTLIQVDNRKTFQIFQQYRQKYGIPVYVIRTNFVTLKGQLIRIISFPIQKTNIFQRQSSLFLVFLFGICVISYILIFFRLKDYADWQDLVFKFLDLITITVPPGLPVSMTFGIIHAIQKLKNKDIYCVSPNKIIMGGLVDFICFDKTGTLTQDFMDFKCLVPCYMAKYQSMIQNISVSEIQSISSALPNIIDILTNMASNHTIVKIQSTGQNIGDPMQIKLFQFGKYRFNDSVSSNPGLQLKPKQQLIFGFQSTWGHQGIIIRRMDFDSQLLRMSVIARSFIKNKISNQYPQYTLYTKGSPQSIYKICDPSTLPKDYDQVLKKYASSGFRVLAICHRKLSPDEVAFERKDLQKKMQYDGFQIFQNPLKPQTRSAVSQLLRARIPCVMITGDNALTGCNISYKCKIANRNKKMLIFNYKQQQNQFCYEQFTYESGGDNQYHEQQQISQQSADFKNQQIQLQQIGKATQYSVQKPNTGYGSQQKNNLINKSINLILSKIKLGNTQICLTGSAYYLIFSNVTLSNMDDSRKTILKATKVYARAKPNDKARIVMSYQQGLGKVVSMCGDGANDCGALKQSDAGLSLSQTQASISAPFTSKIANVSSMVELIKQCRAGLITNFSLFNIMAMYSLIQYSSSLICQYFFSYPIDFAYLYWDLFGNFFFFLVFGYTQTAQKLSKHKPSRSLFTVCNLTQIGIMFIIQLFGQLLMIYSLQNIFPNQTQYWERGGIENNFKAYQANNNDFTNTTPQTNIIFIFANFMYIFTFIAFSISKPWRKQFYTNIPFMVLFVLVLTYDILLVIVPSARLHIFQIQDLTHKMVTLFILLSALTIGFVIYINQKCIMEQAANRIRRRFPTKLWI